MRSSGQLGAASRGRGLSLRVISLVAVGIFGVLALGLVAGLLAASRVVWSATERVEVDTQTILLTEELDRTLREHQRLGNIWLASRDPSVGEARAALAVEARRSLSELPSRLGSSEEENLLASLAADVGAFLDERDALERRGLPLAEIVRKIRPALDRALASCAALQKVHRERLGETKVEAARALRFQYLLAVVAVALLVLGLALVSLGVRRLVLGPVRGLEEAILRFRAGDAKARAEPRSPREMRELALAFNEMADAVAGARCAQLTFLAAVAHDLRNPLSGLKLLVRSVERDPASASPERFRLLHRQLDRLTRMVGDLLDATRIESGNLELRPEDIDLRDVVRAVVELYAPTTSTHEVLPNLPDEPVVVRADPLRIEQVVSNLVSNAIKYSPAGGRVEVSVSAAGGRAELAVSDRGVGIPAEEIAGLFEAFRRRPDAAEKIPGVGLGLSIVRRIVEAHGGSIEVESEPGVGSTFRVRLETGAAGAGSRAGREESSR